MSDLALPSYRVQAYNTAHASENKIHDDSVARRLGFSGGLVPGVEVYAYATHLAVAEWGRAWLEHGHMACRLLKPVYDGNIATVSGTHTKTGIAFTVESMAIPAPPAPPACRRSPARRRRLPPSPTSRPPRSGPRPARRRSRRAGSSAPPRSK